MNRTIKPNQVRVLLRAVPSKLVDLKIMGALHVLGLSTEVLHEEQKHKKKPAKDFFCVCVSFLHVKWKPLWYPVVIFWQF